MKNFFSKLLAVIALVGLLGVAQQASGVIVVHTIAADETWNPTNIVSGAARINSITINTGISGGATNLTYAIVDTPDIAAMTAAEAGANGWALLQRTNAEYASITQYTTNMLVISTSFSGVTNHNTVTALITATNLTAATTDNWRNVAVGTVGSNSAVTITGPFNVIFGVGFTNNVLGVGSTVTIDYDTSL